MPPAIVLGLIAALLFGVSIGSFLNVVIWRLPQGLSVASPTWSFCPNCKTRLGTLDLVPLLSFLALGCKCRTCKKPISWRYFTVEAITGLLFLAIAYHNYAVPDVAWLDNVAAGLVAGWLVKTVFDCLFASILISVFFIDLDVFMIPNRLPFAGFLLGLAAAATRFGLHVWGIAPGTPLSWVMMGPGDGEFVRNTLGPDWSMLGRGLLDVLVAAVVCAAIFHLISFLGYLYYTSHPIEREDGKTAPVTPIGKRAADFVAGVAVDYGYLTARVLGLKYIFPRVRKFVEETDELMKIEVATGDGLSREEIAHEIENDEEQTGMGQGDAKLAGAIGAYLLLPLALVSFFAAILLGAAFGVVLILFFRGRGRTAIPFGPYIVAGALIALFFGLPILHWYMTLLHPGIAS